MNIPTLPKENQVASRSNIIISALSLVGVISCSAMLVPETSDPYKKLDQVTFLMNSGRPIPSERLIWESIAIFSKNGDKKGLAKAYDEYGFFLRSPLVARNSDRYLKSGFIDNTITLDNRLAKSIEYFEKAKTLFIELDQPDLLCHVCYNMGISYALMNQIDSACSAYDASLKYNKENIQRNPNAKPIAPNGYATLEEYLLYCKQKAGCQR